MKRLFCVTSMLLFLHVYAASQVSARDRARRGMGALPAQLRIGRIYAGQHRDATTRQRSLSNRMMIAALSSNLGLPGTNAGFLTATQISSGGAPFAIVAGDFNGDGKKDVAAIVFDSSSNYSLSILLGQGDGTFQPPIQTPLTFDNYIYTRLCVADLNHDGKDDVVIVHSSGSFDVFLSNGDGTFTSPVTYPDTLTGTQTPDAVALSDVNGDGKVDIVVADGTAGNVSTMLGNGDGTFQAPTQVAVPGQFSNAVFADVNGDGRLDLVSSSQVFLASPAGGYQSGTPLLLSGGGVSMCALMDGVVTVADVNGDGQPDVIIAGCQTNTVMVFLGRGDGTFQLGTSVWAGFYPVAVSIADVNGDGIPDILSTNAQGFDVTVLLGNGDGTFQTPNVGYALGGNIGGKPVVADFNGDGKADIIAPQFGLSYLQGFGDGTFAAATDYYQELSQGSAYSVGIASADFNNDGKPDVVLGNFPSSAEIGGVTVLLTNSDGTLKPGVNYGTGYLAFVATGDFNSDGNQDIVAVDVVSGDVVLFLGNGDGTFQSPQTFPCGQGASAGIVVGDFNHDGKPDVAMAGSSSSVFVLLNDGHGGFQAPVGYSITNDGWEIAAADLNGDGNLDLVVTQSGANLSILLGNADGTFRSTPDLALGSSFPTGVAIGDLNGDGKNDIAVTFDDYNVGMGIVVALGNGDGTFQSPTLYPPSATMNLQSYPGEIRMLDLNQDGKLDLVYTNQGFATVGIMYGKGDGTFYAPVEYPAGTDGYGVILVDVNGDGAMDAITGNGDFPGATVLLNAAGNTTALVSSANPSSYGQPVTLTAAVTQTVRGVTTVPTGTVTFMDGGTALGSASVEGSGRASLVVATLSAGNHVLSAVYSGDAAFLPNTSNSVTETVTQTGAADYTLSASPASATIQPGQSAVFNITATPENGFTGTVNFACGPLPQGVSCQFSPMSVTLSDGQPAIVQLTVRAAANALALASASPAPGSNHGLPLWVSFSGGLFGWVLVEGLDTPKRRRLAVLIGVIALIASLSLTGCGGSTGSQALNTTSSSRTVHVTATATAGTNSGSTSQHVINMTVTIEQ